MKILYAGEGLIKRNCFDILQNWAFQHKIFLYMLENKTSENIVIDAIDKFNLNILISMHSSRIFSEEILEAVNWNAFNLHNAKLPDYKGFNTISHAILNGEKIYTTTIHWIVPEIDCGDIAYEEEIQIKGDTAYSLYHRSIIAATRNFKKLLNGLENNNIPRIPQIGEGKFYKKSDLNNYREIRDINNIDEVDVKSRAFHIPPYEPAYYILKGKKFYIKPDES